jgi:hypothetical protein
VNVARGFAVYPLDDPRAEPLLFVRTERVEELFPLLRALGLDATGCVLRRCSVALYADGERCVSREALDEVERNLAAADEESDRLWTELDSGSEQEARAALVASAVGLALNALRGKR